MHRTGATPKRISSDLPRQSPVSFTTNCVSAARPTRRSRAQSGLVSVSRFFENGTQQLPNILERNLIYSAQSSMVSLYKDTLRNTQLSFYRASKPANARPLTRQEAMAVEASVARTLAGRRHGWVYGSLYYQIMSRERRWRGAALIRLLCA